jgi:hypothetical protein
MSHIPISKKARDADASSRALAGELELNGSHILLKDGIRGLLPLHGNITICEAGVSSA